MADLDDTEIKELQAHLTEQKSSKPTSAEKQRLSADEARLNNIVANKESLATLTTSDSEEAIFSKAI